MRTFSREQWIILIAAWLGWGFDAFDALLFNYAAPYCVPSLLHLPMGSPEAAAATVKWTGVMTSILLVGWAVGGVIFGRIADRMGRTRCLTMTIGLYALGTAASALAPNLWVLGLLRFVAALGIGGEWAAGAALVAEVVPERLRIEAGALLYTAAPVGVLMAGVVNAWISGGVLVQSPETGWRFVFLFGLLPALLTLGVRMFVEEPPHVRRDGSSAVHLGSLFTSQSLRLTLTGTALAFSAMLTWWSCNAFAPLIFGGLAQTVGKARGLDASALRTFVEAWKTWGSWVFNVGGIIGVLLTVPLARSFGRKVMFGIFFLASSVSILITFGAALDPGTRMLMYFPIGLTIYGVFGSFTYYLPELFPSAIRATGAGFCYNVGRLVAAAGPMLVGMIASQGLDAAIRALFYTGFIPLLALIVMPWVQETRGLVLDPLNPINDPPR